jgi:sugar phosphate isomerase/epimerase
MALPIGLQLYTLREELAKDFTGVMQKVAEAGYVGVEAANAIFGSTSVQDAAKLFHNLGLSVPGAHSDLPIGDKKNAVLDAMATLGVKYIIAPYMPPEQFKSSDSIKQICDKLNEASANARPQGFTICYHNHWWEMEAVDGRPGYQVMLDCLDPSVGLEIDTYWVQTGGQDIVSVLSGLGNRVPLLHIKDGPCTREAPMTAVGEGIIDWHKVIAAGKSAEWLIVELDRCATDMVEAVVKSINYLKKEGLGRGK